MKITQGELGMASTVYSICGMCAVRCPIRVEVQDGKVTWLEGNPNDAGMGTSLCAKGISGRALLYDDERLQYPMIRDGERGSGKWKRVSWDEAYDYVVSKLNNIIQKHGGKAIMLSDRGGPFADIRKAFLKALGSPNYCNHDCTCGRNTHHASKTVYGVGRTGLAYDFKNAKHIVLFGRNITESFKVKEVKSFMQAVKKGAKVTYIDPRITLTAAKATRFWQIKPGTDYALLLAIANVILHNGLYDKDFVKKYVVGITKLKSFVKKYNPKWAEEETGIPADDIVAFCKEVAADKPKVIFHPGWHLSRYNDSFYASRMIHVINALLGNIEVAGGQFFPKTPKDAGYKGLKSLGADIPKVEEKRADGCGWKYKRFDGGPGLLQLMYDVIDTGEPYPIKAYFVVRHDPLLAMPDPEEQKRILDKLDLIVVVDVNWSETTGFADVILPESTYLERDTIIRTDKGLKPGFSVRKKAIEPIYDTKPGWQIWTELANKLGKGQYFPYKSIEDIWNYQLQDTGFKIEDFDEKGFIQLSKDPIWRDRNSLKFPTSSGKIELYSKTLEDEGLPSFKPYESPKKPGKGEFRLLFGRTGYQTHGQTTNNPIISELMGTNCLWINTEKAKELGIKDGQMVTISNGGVTGQIRAKVTDYIHPEAVFMLHGYGRTIPFQTRAYKKGLADQAFMKGLLKVWDEAGGSISLCESFVKVTPA